MDLQKTKIYLDKLNREYTRMHKDPEGVTRFDLDIMLSYVRELYDALVSEAPAQQIHTTVQAPAVKKTIAKTPDPIEQDAQPPASAPVIPPPPPTPPPVQTPVPPPVVATPPVPPPVVEEPKPVPAAPPQPEPVVAPPKASSPVGFPPEAEALFEEKQARELSDKLADLPITDLRRAIALNDRLLLTRELFSGDGQAFEAAIGALNGYSHFDEARAYLLEHCVIRYGWLDKKRIDAAKNFIKLVRRRYK